MSLPCGVISWWNCHVYEEKKGIGAVEELYPAYNLMAAGMAGIH
jgi:hypothetical protein